MSRSSQTTLIVPYRRLQALDLTDLWAHRELLMQLGWRDVRVRYKQTLLGGLWAIIQPVATMLVFTFLFGRVARLGPDGVPYAVFSYCGLLPWTLYADCLSKSSGSIVAAAPMMKKVYFPRLILPISTLVSSFVDFLVAATVLLALVMHYDLQMTARLATIPLLGILAGLSALAFGLWLAPLNAHYRDIRHVLPFLVQLAMFVTPVIYSTGRIAAQLERVGVPAWVLGLNPMTGVVEAVRWAILPAAPSPAIYLLVGMTTTAVVGSTGLVFFTRMEHSFTDSV